jgi:uncharacterized membrane protein YkvA (DUF1232 family)
MAKNSETLAVSFELSADDLDYFRERLGKARENQKGDEAKIIDAADSLASSPAASEAPAFIRASLAKLKNLTDMLQDTSWRLEGEDRQRVLDALAYFAEPDDLIPDKIRGIGYLDDAIMVELVARELAPEIEAYAEFLKFREARAGADAKTVDNQRDALQRRMRRRGRKLRSGSGSRGVELSPLNLW